MMMSVVITMVSAVTPSKGRTDGGGGGKGAAGGEEVVSALRRQGATALPTKLLMTNVTVWSNRLAWIPSAEKLNSTVSPSLFA